MVATFDELKSGLTLLDLILFPYVFCERRGQIGRWKGYIVEILFLKYSIIFYFILCFLCYPWFPGDILASVISSVLKELGQKTGYQIERNIMYPCVHKLCSTCSRKVILNIVATSAINHHPQGLF